MLVMCLGAYEGGQFEVHGVPPVDVQGKAIIVDGTLPHRMLPVIGHWCIATATLSPHIDSITAEMVARLDSLGFCFGGEAAEVGPLDVHTRWSVH